MTLKQANKAQWKTGNGKVFRLGEMSDSHIQNSMHMLERKIKNGDINKYQRESKMIDIMKFVLRERKIHDLLENKEKVLNTYSWIKVKKYRMDDSLSWEERYKQLESHHLEETNFLIDMVRDLIEKNESIRSESSANSN